MKASYKSAFMKVCVDWVLILEAYNIITSDGTGETSIVAHYENL